MRKSWWLAGRRSSSVRYITKTNKTLTEKRKKQFMLNLTGSSYLFQYEMELFENKAACQTPLECQYHLDVKALKKSKSRRNRRIFTYTDHDRYTNSLPFNQLVRTPISSSASVSHLERVCHQYLQSFVEMNADLNIFFFILFPHLNSTRLYY